MIVEISLISLRWRPCSVNGVGQPRRSLDEALLHTQTSASENFPSKLRDKLRSHTQEVTRETIGSGPQIDLDCIKCPSKKVTYAQVQLRSADEGSTIFYTCLLCGHRWQEDN
ncbi:hypothetical protein P168DRAFT_288585 [Aspergillus campestris IBT 28561]|uniref:DNA-directed RNA polymerase I subunit RPA12 n=1 Tax=Aspergillus campestris (strain IBT 28561) TaxID=1392248 RepID=A0A2I1D9V4_ASPC2|nr:uncharacterized protein P168DRAFT_288585 [Aspergillus campestris IBT 28561]PKY06663.1 hypothetical protein P168DRAFT_288585 [Aspergillus campestris IBT 28561]